MLRLLVACTLSIATPLAFAQKPKPIKPGWNLFSPAHDIQLGKESALQIERKVAIVNNRELTDYVNRIGKKLTAQPEAGQYPYSFKVVYDKSINAFALPGGPAFVHTGLLSTAANEAQIAGVLAHEISHVALRHGTSQVTKAAALQLLSSLSSVAFGGSLLGELTAAGIGLGANSVMLKFSRTAETDADLLGARLMAKAGYDPIEMAHFFETLEAQQRRSGQSTMQFLSDHPNPGNRVKAVSAEVKLMPARSYTKGDDSELRRIQGVVNSLPVPPKANTNFRALGNADSARPSGQMKQFQGKSIALKYPANWEVFQNQQSSEVTIASREGILDAGGNAEIAYGAIIGLKAAGSVDLDRDTKAFLDQLVKTNRGMQASGEQPRRLQVAGAPALLHIVYSSSAYKGQKEIDAIVTAQHPQGLFYMILISPEPEYAKAQPFFEQMIQSVQFSR